MDDIRKNSMEFDGFPVPDEEFFDGGASDWDGTFDEDESTARASFDDNISEADGEDPDFEAETTQLTEEDNGESMPPAMFIIPDDEGAKKHDEIIAALQNLFNKLNERLFDSELGKPIIDIQCGKRGPKKSCWCSTKPAWKRTEAEEAEYYHISFSGEKLAREPIELAIDLIHQMVHIYNAQARLKDTSRAGTYHNSTFKKTAEAHGLICDSGENKKDGFAVIMLPAPLQSYINTLLTDEVFTLIHQEPTPEKPPKKKKTPTPFDDFNASMKDILPNKESATSADIAKVAAKLIKEILRAAPEDERADIIADSDGILSKNLSSTIDREDTQPLFSFGKHTYTTGDNDADEIEYGADDNDSSMDEESDSYAESEYQPKPGTRNAAAPEIGGLRKYACPCCETEIYGPEGLYLSCMTCNTIYVDTSTWKQIEKVKLNKDQFVRDLPDMVSPLSDIYLVVKSNSPLGETVNELGIRTLTDAARADAGQIRTGLVTANIDEKATARTMSQFLQFLKENRIQPLHSSWAQFG